MKIRKWFKYVGIMLSIVSLYSLSLPVYSTYITDGEACDMVIKGYNLVEFSPWGGIVLLTPLALLGLMLSKLKPAIKTIGLFGLLLLDGVALCGASISAYSWITGIATGFVEPCMGHLIYALLFVLATFCFWTSCNFSLNLRDLLPKKELSTNPVEHTQENFYWCNQICDFAKYKEDGETTIDEGVLCIATSEGYFAGLMDDDPKQYHTVEALENNEAVAFVMGTMPTGIYGCFYESKEFLNDSDMQIDIRPFKDINWGDAQLRIPNKSGGFSCGEVKVFPYAPDRIVVGWIDGLEDPPAIGAAVMQDGEVIAFVTKYDAEHHKYRCISAELMVADLCRKINEQKVLEAIHEYEMLTNEN